MPYNTDVRNTSSDIQTDLLTIANELHAWEDFINVNDLHDSSVFEALQDAAGLIIEAATVLNELQQNKPYVMNLHHLRCAMHAQIERDIYETTHSFEARR